MLFTLGVATHYFKRKKTFSKYTQTELDLYINNFILNLSPMSTVSPALSHLTFTFDDDMETDEKSDKSDKMDTVNCNENYFIPGILKIGG